MSKRGLSRAESAVLCVLRSASCGRMQHRLLVDSAVDIFAHPGRRKVPEWMAGMRLEILEGARNLAKKGWVARDKHYIWLTGMSWSEQQRRMR